jgi:NAD(P)-dependent dehydrogenase (short-subunit alcohol dehydrogenase family)
MMHPALTKNATAVVTGAASGIGLAAAHKLASLGLRVCLVDLGGARLDAAEAALRATGCGVLAVATDLANRGDVVRLARTVEEKFGPVSVLLNNAGIQPGSTIFDVEDTWHRILAVNMGGIISVAQVFAPAMIASGQPGLIVNTGSKQGIMPGRSAAVHSGLCVHAVDGQRPCREAGRGVDAGTGSGLSVRGFGAR